MVTIEVITPPPALLTLAEAKAHLRVLHASDDDLILRLMDTAAAHIGGIGAIGGILGRSLGAQELRYTVRSMPRGRLGVVLPRPPLRSIISLSYLDATGASQSISPSDIYNDGSPDRPVLRPLEGTAWPVGRNLSIQYSAGYQSVPAPIRSAMLLLVHHWYMQRGAAGDPQTPAPFAVDALLAPFMTHGWI